MTTPSLDDVRAFWDEHPCGSDRSDAEDRRSYFEDIRRQRYTSEWHIPFVARFQDFRNKDVLEIVCGIGTDGLEFARHGAKYVGVDLSPRSVALARERFSLFGAEGEFIVANAEALPLEAERFDHVYSFGVIHHSPNPAAIVREIHRVLKPGGSFCVMLYNRTSINYRVEITALRRLARVLLYPRAAPRVLARVLGLDQEKLDRHRRLLLAAGRVSRDRWLSMNTDGPDCPLARVYSEREVRALFDGFAEVESDVWFFDDRHWPLVGRLLPLSFRRALGRRWGWHRIERGKKPVN